MSRRQLVGSSSSSSKAQAAALAHDSLLFVLRCSYADLPSNDLHDVQFCSRRAHGTLTLAFPTAAASAGRRAWLIASRKISGARPRNSGPLRLASHDRGISTYSIYRGRSFLGQSQNNEIKTCSEPKAVEQARPSLRERSTVEKSVLRRRWVLLRALLKQFALGEIERVDHAQSCSFASRRQLDDDGASFIL